MNRPHGKPLFVTQRTTQARRREELVKLVSARLRAGRCALRPGSWKKRSTQPVALIDHARFLDRTRLSAAPTGRVPPQAKDVAEKLSQSARS